MDGTQPRHGRRYRDACGAAFALELLGERWSLLIMRELMLGPRRFNALRGGLPTISARVLAERLGDLEAAGVLGRAILPPPASVPVYELTEWGYQADEAMLALCRWALLSPGHDPSLPLSAAALMMSLRATFRPDRAPAGPLLAAIRIADELFTARIADGRIAVARGPGEGADLTLAAPGTAPLKALIYGNRPAEDLSSLGLTVGGDPDPFVACFALR
jgi:DNA-binding HxlR family transcriptional regulator